MSFDTFAIAAMVHELNETLAGGRVQRVTQVNSLTYSFEIYIHPVRHYLTISVAPQAPRIHLNLEKSRRGVGNETPLMLVLRKYMRGAKFAIAEQPPLERMMFIRFTSPVQPIILAVELLGTRSNLILLDTDRAVLGLARLPKSNHPPSGRRVLLPGHYYTPPPPQQKRLPIELSERVLREELNEASPQLPLAKLFPQISSGVSPLLAREIVFRATGDTRITVAQVQQLGPVLEAFHKLFARLEESNWQPTLSLNEDMQPVAFAPYPLTHLPNTEMVPTISEAVERYFSDFASGYAVAKAPLQEAIVTARQRIERRRRRLEEDAAALADPEQLKTFGETILAVAYQIQAGQTNLQVDWLPGAEIRLDPALSPSENAQQYFARYRKAQRTQTEVPIQLENIDLEMQYLDHVENDLAMAENRHEIDMVAAELANAGYYRVRRGRKKQQKQSVSNYLRLTAPGGSRVLVGKNATQNAHLTFNRAKPDDLWLHARNIPGAHVVIPTSSGLPSEEDVLWAAAVAAYYSRARRDTAVDVDVTLKKYVRSVKGAPPGLVTYRQESTLRVTPEFPPYDQEDEVTATSGVEDIPE
jgi:predicted ribosome quality control (RQC) complex YloA/Tae2 family protein